MLSWGSFSSVPALSEPVAPLGQRQQQQHRAARGAWSRSCIAPTAGPGRWRMLAPDTCACQASCPLVSGGTSSVSCHPPVGFRPMGAVGHPSLRSLGGEMSPQDRPAGQPGTLGGCAWLCVLDNALPSAGGFPQGGSQATSQEKASKPSYCWFLEPPLYSRATEQTSSREMGHTWSCDPCCHPGDTSWAGEDSSAPSALGACRGTECM